MYGKIKEHLVQELQDIKDSGLFKEERIISSPQGAEITLTSGEKVLNFCANNYLGLANSAAMSKAAKQGNMQERVVLCLRVCVVVWLRVPMSLYPCTDVHVPAGISLRHCGVSLSSPNQPRQPSRRCSPIWVASLGKPLMKAGTWRRCNPS